MGITMVTLELAQHISRWQHKEHIWGESDCMMFAISFHDTRFNTTKVASIHRKYHSKFEAIRFYKNFVSVESWLKMNGYKPVEDDLQDGDFVIKTHPVLDQGFYYFQGAFATMDEERGLIRIDADVLEYDSAWRK